MVNKNYQQSESSQNQHKQLKEKAFNGQRQSDGKMEAGYRYGWLDTNKPTLIIWGEKAEKQLLRMIIGKWRKGKRGT